MNTRSWKIIAAICIIIAALAAIWFVALDFTEKVKIDDTIDQPSSNHKSGFYETNTEIELLSAQGNVIYTLDGSLPKPGRAKVYPKKRTLDGLIHDSRRSASIANIPTSPIWKRPSKRYRNGVVVTACTYIKGKGMSKPIVITFIANEKNKNPYKIPVVFLTCEAKLLFDPIKGIYILGEDYYNKSKQSDEYLNLPSWLYYKLPGNYFRRGESSERTAFIEIIDNKTLLLKDEVNIKLKGQASRAIPQKSLLITLNKDKTINNLFGRPDRPSHSFVLRNSGGDWFFTLFRDGFFQELLGSTTLEKQLYRPSVVFLNGVYWGIHNIREHQSVQNLALIYQTSPQNVEFAEVNVDSVYTKKEETKAAFNQVIKNVYTLNGSAFWNYAEETFDEIELYDYLLVEIFGVNTDWPNNNVRVFRINDGNAKGKWRFWIYDTDFAFQGFGNTNEYATSMRNHIANTTGFLSKIYLEIMKNPAKRRLFASRYQFMQTRNLNPLYLQQRLDTYKKKIQPYIGEHIERWSYPENVVAWSANVDTIRVFLSKRSAFMKNDL